MSRGYFTIAQGEMYQRFAYGAALSLKLTQPEGYNKLSIGVEASEIKNINPKYLEVFDEVVEIPWDDAAKNSSWKLENEWKSIYMTPYDETMKLDADMLFFSDISKWWKRLESVDGQFCNQVLTYRGRVATSDYYRKTFTESDLPNVYSAMFYFKKNERTFEFFKLSELIFQNWQRYFYEFLEPEHRPEYVSTDVVFAIASKILDFNPAETKLFPTFVHMKSHLQEWPELNVLSEDWHDSLPFYYSDNCELYLGNYKQTMPVHYHLKHFLSDDILNKMEKKLGIA
jgi:hypothetical protein